MERKMLTLQPKVCMLELKYISHLPIDCITSLMIQDQWRCLWGGSGVWCGSMDYTLLSCSHSVWRLERYECNIIYIDIQRILNFHLDQVCSVLARKAT